MSKPSARKSVSTKPPEVQIGGASSALASHGDPVTSRAVSVAKQSSFEVEVGTKEGKGFTYSARAAHHTHTRASASRTLNLHHAMLLSHTHTGSARFRRRSLTRSLAPLPNYPPFAPLASLSLSLRDGDELSEEQLQLLELETAQFSIHVMGVVFDPFRCEGGEKGRQGRGGIFQYILVAGV